ncbi:ribbon-helix-helix protein, CopG family [Nocardia sp. BMG51109]|uniref:type II toxin-antitoxin system VapB family antitoxin n=1 Tax=Nocardia sp. BMG51109 TaxID=1056816 RepID=UPI0004646D52|nr:ribbon-helix-helix protein, CopG family [Nocardia sp. BMG51109]
MTDILIRDIPDAAIEEVDRRARDVGLSRSEFLRRWIARDFQPSIPVGKDDLRRLSELAKDLNDPDVMGRAWS